MIGNQRKESPMTDSEVPDEEILDVLWSAEVARMTTSEIAKPLTLTRRQVLNRLNAMAGDRVEREKVSGTVMWKLHETEMTEPVDPRIGPWARRAKQINDIMTYTVKTGGLCFVVGAVLVFVSLTAAVENIVIPFTSQEDLLIWSYVLLAAGSASVMLAGAGRLTTEGMMAYARRQYS